MKVTNKLIVDLANLSKLKFDTTATDKMKSDLKDMLNFVDKLSEINTKDIQPLVYLSEEINSLRNDKINPPLSQNDALKNAPKKDSDYFKVPVILKKS